MSLQPLTLQISLGLWREKRLFDLLPVPVSILNRDLEIIYGNEAFTQTFGHWEHRKCWEAYHKSREMCRHKSCVHAFEKRSPVVSQGEGVTLTGQKIHYHKYVVPLVDAAGEVPHVLEICIDNTSSDMLRNEYQSLFNLVPCNIAIIDKELRIIEANRMLHDTYGDVVGRECYRALKNQESACSNCIARKAFLTKSAQHDMQAWQTPKGKLHTYQITAVPVMDETGQVSSIMEMGMDVTELLSLREEEELHNLILSETLQNSLRGLIVINDKGEIPILNATLIRLFGLPALGIGSPEELYERLPPEVNEAIAQGGDFAFNDILLFPERGEEAIPVNLTGIRLKKGNTRLGLLLGFSDLREFKALTKARLEAERMAAVGQTVSGLSHGVKNLVTALDGGMYMLTSGMQTNKAERIAQGIDMLQRNIERIGVFVRSFLNFARIREIRTSMGDPAAVALEVAEQFKVKARQSGIELTCDARPGVPPAPIDYESLHECLTNLVTNAIDACLTAGEEQARSVAVNFREENGALVYEVRDTGCGMDEATRKKIFSNFFTTKGMNGTGLGLLMTKKLVQDHGGSIELESEAGQGSTFTIRLPREKLPAPREAASGEA